MAIIGAGPIGLEAGVAFRRAGTPCVILEAGPIGATMGWWAPGTRYFSSPERIAIAGVPLVVEGQEKATREDYLRYLRQVAAQFELPVETFRRVVGVERDGEGFVVRTAPSAHGVGGPEEVGATPGGAWRVDRSWRAERLVLAIGNMHRLRPVGCPGEGLPHVSHYLGDVHRYFGRRVAIVGGRNSAIEAAIRLHRVGAHVTLCQRRADLERERIKYWLLPELEWLIDKGMVGFEPGVEVREITPGALRLERAGRALEVPADDVLLLTGYVQDTTLFEMLGVELHGHERRPRLDGATMETSVPGVYVVGTATGGSQRRAKVFIENSHEHVERVVRAVSGRSVAVRERAVFEGNEEG